MKDNTFRIRLTVICCLIYSLSAAQTNTFPFPENGNVGLGTVSPGQKLEVNGNIFLNNGLSDNGQVGPQLIFNNTFGTTGPNKIVLYNNGNNWAAGLGIKDNTFTLHSGGNFQFYNGTNHGSDGAPTLTILSNGNVGLGNTNPISALQIGNIIGDGRGIYNPTNITMDETFGIGTIGTNFKLKIFKGMGTSTYGLGVSNGLLEVVAGTGGSIGFFTNQTTQSMTITSAGRVGIGITTPDSKLAVNGNIRAKEIKVENANWPDYVFTKDFQLPSLLQTEQHIKEKGHLPGIPSAAEVKTNGIDLGEMNAKLLQKIEELTLHLIEQDKKFTKQESINKKLSNQVRFLIKENQHLKEKRK